MFRVFVYKWAEETGYDNLEELNKLLADYHIAEFTQCAGSSVSSGRTIFILHHNTTCDECEDEDDYEDELDLEYEDEDEE